MIPEQDSSPRELLESAATIELGAAQIALTVQSVMTTARDQAHLQISAIGRYQEPANVAELKKISFVDH